VVDGEQCRCGLRGCWETIATVDWVRAEADRLGVASAATLDASRLVAATDADPAAASLLETYADNIAVGLANITQLLSPGLFILHGDAAAGGERFRALIEAKTRARVFAHIRDTVDVVLSELGDRATLLGAAGLVLSETFHLAA
jgi:predicted NBD/HSP70 family sugar kinase